MTAALSWLVVALAGLTIVVVALLILGGILGG